MGIVSKQLELPEGLSVSLTRPKDGPQFYIFDPDGTSFEVPEGFDVVMFLVPNKRKDVLNLAAKLQHISSVLKMEAAKLPKD